jgi:hypothetical protein
MQRFGLPSRLVTIGRVNALMVFKSVVIHHPPLLLPGLSALQLAMPSKIIPRISREASDWPAIPN